MRLRDGGEGHGSKSVAQYAGLSGRDMHAPLKSKHDVSVECRKGCARGTGTISSNLEGMTAGNIVVGGVVGFGVDAATGAMNKYNENNQIAMSNDPNCQG